MTSKKKQQQTKMKPVILDSGEKVTHLYCNAAIIKDPYFDSSDFAGQQGVITIVSKRQSNDADDVYSYGISLCSPGDNFSKKTGIAIARERRNAFIDQSSTLLAGNVRCRQPRFQDILQMIMIDILCNSSHNIHKFPIWARNTLILETSNPSRLHFMSL